MSQSYREFALSKASVVDAIQVGRLHPFRQPRNLEFHAPGLAHGAIFVQLHPKPCLHEPSARQANDAGAEPEHEIPAFLNAEKTNQGITAGAEEDCDVADAMQKQDSRRGAKRVGDPLEDGLLAVLLARRQQGELTATVLGVGAF